MTLRQPELSFLTADTAMDQNQMIVQELELWRKKLGLSDHDARYFRGLYAQRQRGAAGEALKIGQNFFPSALLNREEREKLLGVVEERQLHKKARAYRAAAKNCRLVLNPMNGGIGS